MSLHQNFFLEKMPSILNTWTKREAPAAPPNLPEKTESSVTEASVPPPLNVHQEALPETSPTEAPGLPLTTAEPGGEHLRKHIFGNKTFHPSHGRTTPFPESGIT